LQWLLPDWPWEIHELDPSSSEVRVRSPHGWIRLVLGELDSEPIHPGWGISLVRAGRLLFGPGPASPTGGWVSPTYGQKLPALSISLQLEFTHSLTLKSEFFFPDSPD